MINLKLIGAIAEAAMLGAAIGVAIAGHAEIKAVDTILDIQKNNPDDVQVLNNVEEAEKANNTNRRLNKGLILALVSGWTIDTYTYFKYGMSITGNLSNPINLLVAIVSGIGVYIYLTNKNRRAIQLSYCLKETYGND